MLVNRENVGQLVSGHGGRLEPANLRGILNTARHIVDCERCQFQHRNMITFASPLRIDYFLPHEAPEVIERAQFAFKQIEKMRAADASRAAEQSASQSQIPNSKFQKACMAIAEAVGAFAARTWYRFSWLRETLGLQPKRGEDTGENTLNHN